MKRLALGLVSLIVGSLNLYLLAGTDEYSGVSVAGLALVFFVSLSFIAYGIGGNVALSRIPLISIFSKPMNKGFLKNLAGAERA